MKNDYSRPDEYDDEYGDSQPEVDARPSAVASSPRSRAVFFAIAAVVSAITVYLVFFTGGSEEDQKKQQSTAVPEIPKNIEPVTQNTGPIAIPVPSLPEAPPITVPTPPPPPAPPPVAAPEPLPTPVLEPTTLPSTDVAPVVPIDTGDKKSSEDSAEAKAQRDARLKSGIMIVGGGGKGGMAGMGGSQTGAAGGTGSAGGSANPNDPNAAVGEGTNAVNKLLGKPLDSELGPSDFRLGKTQAEQAKATLIARDMSAVVAQGKIIDAVLETAINTDFPGMLRAVISRDVYAETGKNILLPKGSRLIGRYQSDVKRGQRRVQVVWSRVIRPDGIDIAIESPGTDQLGRSGIEGEVDNRWMEIFGSSLLVSIISIGAAIGAETITDSDGVSETNNSDGSRTRSGKASDFAIVEGVENFGDVASDLAKDVIKIQPTITVKQGTNVKVFVNRDLIFPASVATDVRYVR